MPAYASCDFPLVNKWKNLADQNSIIGFFDSVLSSFGQIAFSDNPLSGALIIIACFIGSPIQIISSIWSTVIAIITAMFLGVSNPLIRQGLYGFNAALAGLAIPLFIFPGQGFTPMLFIYTGIGAICCVIFTAAISYFFSKLDLPPLALPYSITLLVILPGTTLFKGLNSLPTTVPRLIEYSNQPWLSFTIKEFFLAFSTGIAQVIWQTSLISGIIYLIAILLSSRIDGASAVIAAVISTFIAIVFKLPKESIMMGIYSYNSVLLFQVIFGRGFVMSAYSFGLSVFLAALVTIFSASLSIVFAPLGAAVSGFPYSVLGILALLSKGAFKNLSYVSPKKWGVPETIYKYREQQKKLNHNIDIS